MAKKQTRKRAAKTATRAARSAAGSDAVEGNGSAAGGEPPEQFSLPDKLVDFVLLGRLGDRRVLQDSPLLADVWLAYATDPGSIQDLLITPHRDVPAAQVARRITELIDSERIIDASIAYLQGIVGAELTFAEVLQVLVPLTQWWNQKSVQSRLAEFESEEGFEELRTQLTRLLAEERYTARPTDAAAAAEEKSFSSLVRYIGLAGLIYWMGKLPRPSGELKKFDKPEEALALLQPHLAAIVDGMLELYQVVRRDSASAQRPGASADDDAEDAARSKAFVFQVSLNRQATAALERSVPAVKADAAKSLFQVKCNRIVWAVCDSGIDAGHPAFQTWQIGPDGKEVPVSRVRKTLDFTRVREITSTRGARMDGAELEKLADGAGISTADARIYLKAIADGAGKAQPTNWDAIEELIKLKSPPLPVSPHGTHVAGIIGADKIAADRADREKAAAAKSGKAKAAAAAAGAEASSNYADGMCPDIRLYDFRVLAQTVKDTEFAVIAALQYIRYVNDLHTLMTIHGVNLSLSIPHSVRNYACGRTPVCIECERLVEAGVVVVAAAGNRGYHKFETADGLFENYAAFSITDPGNGDGVITVGSTHGGWPHTYGISFFSSRGPTGDGRMKPDLVAPGERVLSTVRNGEWAAESGTSMAAPHVSGAAAMLLARYDELIGQPRRVKRILCDSATDLGRERSFQGHGMLDVLRAFQSI